MNRNKLITMLKMQDDFNKRVNPNWINSKYNWSDAIMVEGVEAMEHYGQWKWWKKQEPNFSQTKLELVDIWHFLMSDMMESVNLSYNDVSYIEKTADIIIQDYVEYCNENKEVNKDPVSVNSYFRELIGNAANQYSITKYFYKLLTVFDMDFSNDNLFNHYICKNALNIFRQKNGYKTGTYVKVWNGKEDNEVLYEFISNNKIPDDNALEFINDFLNSEYSLVIAKSTV